MGVKISNELIQLVAIHGEETPQLRLQVYVNARGVDSGGRVCGYGEMVTPDMMQLVNQGQPTLSICRSLKGQVYASLESDFLVYKVIVCNNKRLMRNNRRTSRSSNKSFYCQDINL